jgi:hypothetical protein
MGDGETTQQARHVLICQDQNTGIKDVVAIASPNTPDPVLETAKEVSGAT